jgi:glutamyl endopeptidase
MRRLNQTWRSMAAGLMVLACHALPLVSQANPLPDSPPAPVATPSPDGPGAQLDASRLAWPEIRPPALRRAWRPLPLGAETQEVTHVPGGETRVSVAAAERLHGSAEIGRRSLPQMVRGSAGPGRVRIQGVVGRDDRTHPDVSVYPLTAVCKLFMTFQDGSKFIGSGALISPKHVLTAGHCVFGSDHGGWVKSIEVVPGMDGRRAPFGSAWATQMRCYRAWVEQEDRDHDFALITLDREIGQETGWFGYATFTNVVGLTGHISGYPGDLDDGMVQYAGYGPIDDATDYQVLYRIDTYGGQSGSGVYEIDADGSPYIFAVHTWGAAQINGGTRLNRAKFDSIEAWMQADG